MNKMRDSGNLVIGLENNTVDLFDNPFIRIAAYKLTETYELKEEIKVRKCTEADLLTMMPK